VFPSPLGAAEGRGLDHAPGVAEGQHTIRFVLCEASLQGALIQYDPRLAPLMLRRLVLRR
jgi:hypothetical protein